MGWDDQVFVAVNGALSGPASSAFFGAVTHLGDGAVLAAIVLLPMLLLDRRRFRDHAIAMIVTVALSGLAVNLLKVAVDRPRPPERFAAAGVAVHTPCGVPSDRSFPSGHTQTSFGAAVYLSRVYPAGAPVFLALASLVGLSRVAIGVHFPADVLCGAAFGAIFALAGFSLNRRRLSRRGDPDRGGR